MSKWLDDNAKVSLNKHNILRDTGAEELGVSREGAVRNKLVQRKLKHLLSQNLVTIKKVANDIGINYSNLSNFKNGRSNYSDRYLDCIEPYLDLWLDFGVKLNKYIKNNI